MTVNLVIAFKKRAHKFYILIIVFQNYNIFLMLFYKTNKISDVKRLLKHKPNKKDYIYGQYSPIHAYPLTEYRCIYISLHICSF